MTRNKEEFNIKYKVKTLRLAEKTWSDLKEKQGVSGKSWNLFIVELLNKKPNGQPTTKSL